MLFEDTSRNGEAVRNSEPTRQRIKSGQPYSDDLRSRVISAIENGASYRQAAARHGVSASVALKWMRRFRETGSAAARPMGGARRAGLKGKTG